MTNETFMLLSDKEKLSKFKTALKNKTNNELTDKEVEIIIASLPNNSQYSIRVYREPEQFCSMLILANARNCRALFGSVIPGVPGITETAFCSSRSSAYLETKETGIINIYIPKAMQQKGTVS